MTNADTPTLDTFFEFSQAMDSDGGDLGRLETSQSMTRIRKELKEAAGKQPAAMSARQLQGPISQLLGESLLDIIVRAWNENHLFEKFLDPDQYDPDESVLISLKKHSLTSSHRPHVDVSLNGKVLGRIDFAIELALTLEGVILELRAGKLRELRVGKLQGSGTLKCEDLVLVRRDTGPVDFPGTIRFDD